MQNRSSINDHQSSHIQKDAKFKNGGDFSKLINVGVLGEVDAQIPFLGAPASDSALDSANNLTYSESGFNPTGSLRYTMLGASSNLCGSIYNGL